MENLILVPLDDSILFPGMTATLAVETGDEERVLLVPRTDGEFASVGTVADVVERMRIPGGGTAVTVEGVRAGRARAPRNTDAAGTLRVEVTVHEDPEPQRRAASARSSASTARWSRRSSTCAAPTRASARSCAPSPGPGPLADTSGYSPDLSLRDKIDLLETLDVTERLERALELQRERLAELQVRAKIRDDVQQGAEHQQREYFLRKQMESIRKELGEDEASVADEYRTKIEEAGMPDAVREQAEKELGAARADGRLLGRVLDDPHLPRLAGRRCRGRSAPRSGSTRCTRVRCWTPTTPASRTSRTASPSTSPCASCASSAA